MSTGISNADLIDLQRTTLANLPDMEFEVALSLQNFPVIDRWFGRNKKQIESGTSIERNIMLDTTGNARHVKLYQKTPINVGDVQHKFTAPWVQVQTHYSIERREALRNRAPARYIDMLKGRRIDATLDLAKLLERRAWSTPNSASDDLNPRGLPYWLSMCDNGVTSDGDFIGKTIRYGDGSTSTNKAGIDGAVGANAMWRNYAGTYTAIDGDFVRRMRRAFHACDFKSPITVEDLQKGPSSMFKIYMGLDTLVAYEELTASKNEGQNYGNDLAKFHGNTVFRRVEIVHTPQLNTAAYAPVYAVNHGKYYPVVQDGDWMRESDPMVDLEQHNVLTTFIDGSYQFLSINVRESGFVLHQPIAA
jgi:hypothetical protein